MTKPTKLSFILGLALLLPGAGTWAGDAPNHPENNKNFQKNHPRRTEVLKRTDKQKNRVNKDLAQGKLTGKQGAKIKAEDRAIRSQEQAEAKANGGHITKGEQKQLNREENRVNKQIKRDEAKNTQTNQ
jgi:hypothetical protein